MTVVVVMDGSRGDSDGKYLMMTIMEILGDKVYIRGVDIGMHFVITASLLMVKVTTTAKTLMTTATMIVMITTWLA